MSIWLLLLCRWPALLLWTLLEFSLSLLFLKFTLTCLVWSVSSPFALFWALTLQDDCLSSLHFGSVSSFFIQIFCSVFFYFWNYYTGVGTFNSIHHVSWTLKNTYILSLQPCLLTEFLNLNPPTKGQSPRLHCWNKTQQYIYDERHYT